MSEIPLYPEIAKRPMSEQMTFYSARGEPNLPLGVRKTGILKTRSLIKVPFSRRFVTSPQYTAGM